MLAAATWHLAGVELVHVPYRGAQAVYQDLLGGRVDLFFDLAPTARAQVQAGSVKALATSGSMRNPMHPDDADAARVGVDPTPQSWFGLFRTGAHAAPALSRLREELQRAARSTDLRGDLHSGRRPTARAQRR